MKRYTVCEGPRGHAALLFSEVNLAETVSNDPAVAALFNRGYFITNVNRADPTNKWRWRNESNQAPIHTLVCFDSNFTQPDKASLNDAPLVIYRDGLKLSINLRKRYNECLSFFKAVGCAECPSNGIQCLSEYSKKEIAFAPQTEEMLDAEEMLERLSKEKPTIAGFEYVDPGLTRIGEFTAKLRGYWEHDFTNVDENIKNFSDRATKAATTRKFAKVNCSVCVLEGGCERARCCSGPYEPEDLIIAKSAQKLRDAISTSPLKPWQIWELNFRAGVRSKHSRWEIMLMGVRLGAHNELIPSIYRAKTRIDEYRKLNTYEEIAEVFGLATHEENAAKPIVNEKCLALWWQTLNLYQHHKGGWSPRRLVGAVVNANGVNTNWAKSTYHTWDQTITHFYEISSKISYGKLPDAEQLTAR